jgi:hypothetical protein
MILIRSPAACDPEYLAELRRWARHWTMQHVPVYADPDSFVLLMTEIVTDAICHSAGPVDVELDRGFTRHGRPCQRGSDTLTRPLAVATEAEGGRGRILLERLSSRWGVRTHPRGDKAVCCEFT